MKPLQVTNEATLQRQIVKILRLKGIVPIVSRMDRRTSNNVGTPDILFACYEIISGDLYVYACAWEVKMPKGIVSREQCEMAETLQRSPNSWRYRVIRSVDEAVKELKEMGL